MKTIRETLDQLDEITRRDLLKGTGAATALAGAGAIGYKTGQSSLTASEIPKNPQIYYIVGRL